VAGIQSVIGDDYGLGVAQFRERLHVEAEIALRVVALGGGNIGLVREGISRQQADARIIPAFREVVIDRAKPSALSRARLLRSSERSGDP
jgi:predicted phage gp36 major capsid-like protein